MEDEYEQVLVVGASGQADAQQRRAIGRHRRHGYPVEVLAPALSTLSQIDSFERHRHALVNPRERLAVVAGREVGPEDRVAVDDDVDRLCQLCQIRIADEREPALQVVCAPARVQLAEIPEGLLHRTEPAARPVSARRNRRLQLDCLRSFRRRGRVLDRSEQALVQPGDRGLVEQRANRDRDAEFRPHPGDRNGGQNRVSADVEEILPDADALALEDILENPL
jgi:hypothetical protein